MKNYYFLIFTLLIVSCLKNDLSQDEKTQPPLADKISFNLKTLETKSLEKLEEYSIIALHNKKDKSGENELKLEETIMDNPVISSDLDRVNGGGVKPRQ